MTPSATFLFALAAAYGIAFCYGLILRKVQYSSLTAVAVVGILSCPLLIPADCVVARALMSLCAADLVFKAIELRRMMLTTKVVLEASSLYHYLAPFPFLLVVYQEKEGKILQNAERDPRNIGRMLCAFLVGVVAIALIGASWHLPYLASNFLYDHTLKLLIFTVFLEALSRWLYRVERFVGYDTTPIINNVLSSRTVSDFWQLYNTRVHSWFHLNLFRPARRVSPAWGVALVFIANGLLHELMFGVTTGRFDGYQLLFFLTQIPAVLVSGRMRKFAIRNGLLGEALVRCFTIAWMLMTTMLFFHGVNRIIPFYSATPWLP